MRQKIRCASYRPQPLALSITGRLEEPCSCLGSHWIDSDRPTDDQPHPGRPCVLLATDISAQIGQMNCGRAARLIASFADFPEPAELIEGVPHVADRSRSACFCSYICAEVQVGCHQICCLLCRLDRREPPAGQSLRIHLPAPVPFAIQPQPRPSGILGRSMRSGWGSVLPGTQAPLP
jgi:hypothetical protein